MSLFGLIVLSLTAFTHATRKIGTLNSPNCFEPIAKFAYHITNGDPELEGRFHARIQFRQEAYKNLYLVTYNHEEWRHVHRSNLTCAQRLDLAKDATLGPRSRDYVVIPVYQAYWAHERIKDWQTGEDRVACSDGTVRFDTRYRIQDSKTDWYYVALINADPEKCNKTRGVRCQGPLINITYRLNFRNLRYVSWMDAFPANKIGLFHITNFNLVACLGLVVITVIVSYKLRTMDEYHYIVESESLKRQMIVSKKLLQSNEVIERFGLPPDSLVSKPKHVKDKFHITIKGLVASIFCYFLANLFWFVHWVIFCVNEGTEPVIENLFLGNNVRILYMLGETFWIISDAMMATIGISLAKGWTLVRRKLSARSRAIYGMLLSFYFYVGWGAIFWNATFYTEFDSVDFYDSLPAGLLFFFRFVIFGGFIWAIITTIRSFKVKRRFFIKFAVFYGLWFTSFAIFAAIVNSVGRAYLYREALLHITMSFCILLAQFLLIFMYWPGMKCCLAKRFPFHADVDDMLNPAYHEALNIIADNEDLSARQIAAKIRENDNVDPLSKLLAILKHINTRLELIEDNEVDLRCAFEELEDEDERMDVMGEDLDGERRAPKLQAFGASDFAEMQAEHDKQHSRETPH